MISTAIVIFRETLEIAMIIGIVLAATRGLPRRNKWILIGMGFGLLGAALVAFFANSIAQSLSGTGQEIFNAVILFSAAILIGWTVLWMKKHAFHLVMHLKNVGRDAMCGSISLYSLSLIIGLAMLREGSEMVLFLYGMVLSGEGNSSIVYGSLIGLLAGAAMGVMLYYGLLKMPARYALKVTSWLLLLLVAGLASQGAAYLLAAGFFSDFSPVVWDTSGLLSENSYVGKALHGLIGYTAKPTQIQLLFYAVTLFGLLALMTAIDRPKKTAPFLK